MRRCRRRTRIRIAATQPTFVTREITRAVARIVTGLDEVVYFGNLDAERDWGHAHDYVRAMWLTLQQEEPDDYVIGTGQSRSIRELCEVAFDRVGLDWEPFVRVDPRYFRPVEVERLHSDPTKATTVLGWKPEVSFEALIHEMVDADLWSTD